MRAMPYRAVLFDFDMTLADTSHVIADLLNQTALDFGFPPKSYEEVLPIIGNTHEIMLSHVTGVRDQEKILEMRTHYRTLCCKEMPLRTTFFPGVRECLAAIRKNGAKIGLVSLKLQELLLISLQNYGLDPYFSVILGCEDVAAPKPDPSGLLCAASRMEVSPRETLYIGDSLVDEGAARNAAMDFGAMLTGGTRRNQFDPSSVRFFFTGLDDLRKEFDD